MMRTIVIALAAAAAVIAVSTLAASARSGGMGHGGMGHGGFARMGVGHAGFARPGFVRPGGFAAARPFAFRGNRFAFRHHRFHRNRLVFVGAGLPYAYYDSCYRRIWTPWGWRWSFVCY